MVQIRTMLLYLLLIKQYTCQLVNKPTAPPPPLNIQQLLSSTETVSLQQKTFVDGIISYATNQSFNSYNNNINSNKNKLSYKSNNLTPLSINKSNKSVNNPNIYVKNDNNLLILNSTNSNYSNETSTNQSDSLSNQSNSKLNKPISSADDDGDETRATTTVNSYNANKFDKFYKIPIKYVNKSWSNKRNLEKKSIIVNTNPDEWECPNITNNRNLECACDLIYTLRCGSGDVHGLELISKALRESKFTVSLLDCTLKNVTVLNEARIFENVSLHGLVISSGEIKRIHRSLFLGMKTPLQTLGLPNNALTYVPWSSMQPLMGLDRLDLSNNKIKSLGAPDFVPLQQLTYLELSENQISSISVKTFMPLKKLSILKLNDNRLGDNPVSLKTIELCVNLRELGLKSNLLKGPIKPDTLPWLTGLESLDLDKNVFTSIRNGAFHAYPNLITLSLRHNQIDVLQDHAFALLASLQVLDLAYNGIVAISSSSLKHLPKLLVLDLTYNFLRALTSDLIAPLPSLKELRLDGNDISAVAKTALMNATELHSLSLQDNPLACDCNLKPFAEWLSNSTVISSNDLLGAVCATPPHLEGAPLLQIPLDSLSCDNNAGNSDKKDAFLRVAEILKNFNRNMTINKDNDVVRLNESHFAPDYGLILTWIIKSKINKYSCDSIFIFKKQDWKLQDEAFNNLPINCESNLVEDENTVTFIIPETELLQIGERYRFCVTLLQQTAPSNSTLLGCSGYIELLSNATTDDVLGPQADEPLKMYPKSLETPAHNFVNKMKQSLADPINSDISNFEQISGRSDEISIFDKNLEYNETDANGLFDQETTTDAENMLQLDEKSMEMIDNMRINKNFLPGLGLGILLSSIIIFVWSIFKFRKYRSAGSNSSTCYDDDDSVNAQEVENGNNKYVKLQATTTL